MNYNAPFYPIFTKDFISYKKYFTGVLRGSGGPKYLLLFNGMQQNQKLGQGIGRLTDRDRRTNENR